MMVPRSWLCPSSVRIACATILAKSLASFSRAWVLAAMPFRFPFAAAMACWVLLYTAPMSARLARRPRDSSRARMCWESQRTLASPSLVCSWFSSRSAVPICTATPCTLPASTGVDLSSMSRTRNRMLWVSFFLRSAVSISNCRFDTLGRCTFERSCTKASARAAAACTSSVGGVGPTLYLPCSRSMRFLSVLSCWARESRIISTSSALFCMLLDILPRKSSSSFHTASVNVELNSSSSAFCSFSASTPCSMSALALASAASARSFCCQLPSCSSAFALCLDTLVCMAFSAATVRLSSVGVMRTAGARGRLTNAPPAEELECACTKDGGAAGSTATAAAALAAGMAVCGAGTTRKESKTSLNWLWRGPLAASRRRMELYILLGPPEVDRPRVMSAPSGVNLAPSSREIRVPTDASSLLNFLPAWAVPAS
mmetsp:Transcript_90397/g.235319  ORF Transcript_90397/g.235319 Transcript_90397/m.235319 type:complete len:429 (-) Transcript_90397:409-1695(-)